MLLMMLLDVLMLTPCHMLLPMLMRRDERCHAAMLTLRHHDDT